MADDEPFTYPANNGSTGIMEIPTARVMSENHYRAGVSQIEPYRYYYMSISPLDRLEITGRVTEIMGVRADTSDSRFQGYGNTKDKSLDIKYQFLKESKWMPAASLVISDPQGTRLYASQSIVASKQLYPFDFTMGFGNGRFGKNPLTSSGETFKAEIFTNPKAWWRDAQFFWGVQMALSEKYALMMEYNPIRYSRQSPDPARDRYFLDEPPSKFNWGLRWKPFTWSEIDFTYQRGEKFGVNASVQFDLGQSLRPLYTPPFRENKKYKTNPLKERFTEALYEAGFSDIAIVIDGADLWIEAQNDRYFDDLKAVGIAARIIDGIAPLKFSDVHIILTRNSIPIFDFATTGYDISEWQADRLTSSEFYYLARIDTTRLKGLDAEKEHKQNIDYGIKPALETYVNDPSGFFKYRLGADAWMSWNPWSGASFTVGLEAYPLNNISTSVEPLYDDVRSDIALYKEKDVAMSRLMASQTFKLEKQTYGRLSGGYLEMEFAGLSGEIARPVLDGRLFLGLESSVVKKRDPDSTFGLKDGLNGKTYYTMFLNSRLNVPELNASIDVKAGRFLGGDTGARLTVSKHIKGITIYGWYSVTDTSIFRDPDNRGYHDKGIGITIPIYIFRGTDSKTAYSYGVSPWTRDVAQDIYHYETIFDYIGRAVPLPHK